MTLDNLDVYLNFRVGKGLRDIIDKRAEEKGVSRATMARQYFEMGTKLPENVPLTFAQLLYERTTNTRDAIKVRKVAVAIIEELFL